MNDNIFFSINQITPFLPELLLQARAARARGPRRWLARGTRASRPTGPSTPPTWPWSSPLTACRTSSVTTLTATGTWAGRWEFLPLLLSNERVSWIPLCWWWLLSNERVAWIPLCWWWLLSNERVAQIWVTDRDQLISMRWRDTHHSFYRQFYLTVQNHFLAEDSRPLKYKERDLTRGKIFQSRVAAGTLLNAQWADRSLSKSHVNDDFGTWTNTTPRSTGVLRDG